MGISENGRGSRASFHKHKNEKAEGEREREREEAADRHAEVMAAAAPSSSSSVAEIDELRGALASKGLVLKDSILARVARSKSLKDLVVPTETVQETRREEASKEEEADEELGFEKRLRALITDGSKKEDHEAAVGVGSKEEERGICM